MQRGTMWLILLWKEDEEVGCISAALEWPSSGIGQTTTGKVLSTAEMRKNLGRPAMLFPANSHSAKADFLMQLQGQAQTLPGKTFLWSLEAESLKVPILKPCC